MFIKANNIMWIVITSLIIAMCVLIYILVDYIIKNKYKNFVEKNSIAIKKVIELNQKYKFVYVNLPYLNHNYDNEKLFNAVSCHDYLVYHLQYYSNRQEILQTIETVKANNIEYSKYLDEYKRINLGEYEADTGKLKVDKLIKIEKEMFKKYDIHPVTQFKLHIELRLYNMGNAFVAKRWDDFSELDVNEIIYLLNDKNGKFYNNRGIWESICRVERAKVTNKMRFSIYARDYYTCRMCHRRFPVDELEVDHIYPIAKGGKSVYDNLQTLCKWCNKEKGDKVI